MAYTALYRKYRPMVFEEVIGQAPIVETLKNQIRQGSIAHAYLFAGIRGTGKTSTAKILARAVNCLDLQGSDPCNRCALCKGILDEAITDVVEIDAASNNSVDDIRELRENVRYAPAKAKNKVYIIDEVHMLSKGAFNALLKTLEEPPAHTVFILATTEPEKIPETIRSRCQRFDFRRIGPEDLAERMRFILKDLDVEAEDGALELIVRNADGAVRDGLSLLDQCLAFSEGPLTRKTVQSVMGVSGDGLLLEFVERISEGDADGAFLTLEELFAGGKETGQLLRDLTGHFRSLMLAGLDASAEKILGVDRDRLEAFKGQRKRAGMAFVLRGLDLLSDYEYRIKYAPQPRILLEMLVLRLMRPEYDDRLDAVLQRLERTEKALEALQRKSVSPGIPGVAAEPGPPAGTRGKEAPKEKPEAPFNNLTGEPRTANGGNRKPDGGPAGEKPAAPEKTDPAAVFSTGMVAFNAVADRWEEILEGVREEKVSTHAFLREAVPKDIRNGRLVLLFKEGYWFHMNNLNSPENKAIIEKVLSREAGMALGVECLMEDDWKGAGGPEDEVARIKEVFKGLEDRLEIED